MTDHFTNLDAQWLSALADALRENPAMDDELQYVSRNLDEVIARLRLCAQHIQSLDERNAVLMNNQTYDQGYAAALRELRRRSNIEPQTVDDGKSDIFNQIDRMVAEGKLKRVPLGERALDDRPDKFNAPVRRKPQPRKDDIDIKLDLSGLDF